MSTVMLPWRSCMNTEADKMAENQKSLLSHNVQVVQLVEECNVDFKSMSDKPSALP